MPIVTRIWLGAFLLAVAATVWLAPALVGMALEGPVTSFASFVREHFGTAGQVVFMIALIGGGYGFAWRSQRRHEARQFAQDKTIHVEKPRAMGGAEKAFLVVAGGALWLGVMGLIVQAVIVTVR